MPASSYADDHLDVRKLQFVDVAGTRTRYYEDGSGDPLILVHGGEFGFISGLDDWSLNLDAFAQHFRVIAVDKLGQGHTDNPKADADYTFECTFQHFVNFLQTLEIMHAHFVGHSRGGFLITYLALEHPAMVKTLVIVDSNTTAPENPEYPSDYFYEDLTRRMPPGPATKQAVHFACAANSYSDAHNHAGHYSYREQPQAFNRLVQEFCLR